MLFKPAPISLAVTCLVIASLLALPSRVAGTAQCFERGGTTLCITYVPGQGLSATVDVADGTPGGRRLVDVSDSERGFPFGP